MTFGSPFELPARSEEAGCLMTLFNSQNRLKGNLAVDIRANIVDLSDYKDNPTGRSLNYTFTLSGQASESVFKSVRLQESIAKDIISNCSEIASVSFAPWASGWSNTFGLMGGNTVQAFECIVPSRDGRTEIRWGQISCT
jgi:hypothetical protein